MTTCARFPDQEAALHNRNRTIDQFSPQPYWVILPLNPIRPGEDSSEPSTDVAGEDMDGDQTNIEGSDVSQIEGDRTWILITVHLAIFTEPPTIW